MRYREARDECVAGRGGGSEGSEEKDELSEGNTRSDV